MFRLKTVQISLFLILLLVLGGGGSSTVCGQTSPGAEELSQLKTYTADQLNAALATLDDKEVRAILLAQLQQEAGAAGQKDGDGTPQKGLAGILAHYEQVFEMVPHRVRAMLQGLRALPAEMGRFIDQVTEGRGLGRFLLFLVGVTVIAAVSYGVERLIPMPQMGDPLHTADRQGGMARFGGAVIAAVPSLVGIIVFMAVAALLCMVFLGAQIPIRHLYGPILSAVVLIRLLMLGVGLLCAPRHPERRLLSIDDATAATLQRTLNLLVIAFGVIWAKSLWFKRMGISEDSFLLINLTLGTLFLILIGALVWRYRTPVASYLTHTDNGTPPSHLSTQLASIWHILVTVYLFWIWFAWAGRLMVYGPHFGQAFIRSLLVIPLFLFIDHLMEWLLPAVLGTASTEHAPDQPDSESSTDDAPLPVRNLRTKMPLVKGFVRLVIALILFVWLMKAFGVEVPYIAKIAVGGFDILVTIVLALLAWRLLNRFITRKLEETAPAPTEDKSDDDEFGSGVVLDRSHTLLPMLRKFIGTVLLVMVIMIILSSLGINIGPLLAGAGVIGLAIGFGAQKLVADVLSGFFFLMDDAFRVGEYIQAGSVSGSVEAITLRNVMMRHHRGALQIVPFSELGTITNLMRGGMVIKFSMDLPYDTDIEKVRKIIKKVGKKMLKDPDLADDFIQPVKSQGVKSVGDSVMTFRVKFTAKPGKQFVIKREAFRRIKEALEAKGIYLAHRKVIVELPEGAATEPSAPAAPPAADQQDQLIKAGAAAALASSATQQPK